MRKRFPENIFRFCFSGRTFAAFAVGVVVGLGIAVGDVRKQYEADGNRKEQDEQPYVRVPFHKKELSSIRRRYKQFVTGGQKITHPC